MGANASQPRTIFITGVSAGIGRATALHFAAKGWQVFGTVMNGKEVEDFKRELPTAIIFVVDIRDEDAVKSAAKAVSEAVGDDGLDVLFNNAGVTTCAPLELTAPAELRTVFEVNVLGTCAVIRNFLPLLRRAAAARPRKLYPPRIITTTSLMGRIALPWAFAYAASKAALEAVCDSLRLELRSQGIRVIAIEPHVVHTNFPNIMWASAQQTLDSAKPELHEVYKEDLARGVKLMQTVTALFQLPTQRVVNTVYSAATAMWPASRYPTDMLGPLCIFVRERLLTDALWDWWYALGEDLVGFLSGLTMVAEGKVPHSVNKVA